LAKTACGKGGYRMRDLFGFGSKNKARGRMKEPFGDRVFNVINFIFVTIFFLLVLYPIIYVLSSSVSDPLAIIQGRVRLVPVGFNFDGYRAVFRHDSVLIGYRNSLFYMIVGTAFNVFMTVLAAYPLSRRDFPDRGKITMLFAFTMLFSGGLIPTFLLIRSLGLIDTPWVMILPGGFGVMNVIITRTFFQTNIPDELLESAQLDGCSDFKFITSVVLPLSGAILAVQALMYALGHWNAFFSALIYLRSPELFPLQMVLREILLLNQVDTGVFSDIYEQERREHMSALLRYALIVAASLPFMIFYPLVQRFFVKGMLVGSIKG